MLSTAEVFSKMQSSKNLNWLFHFSYALTLDCYDVTDDYRTESNYELTFPLPVCRRTGSTGGLEGYSWHYVPSWTQLYRQRDNGFTGREELL